MKARTKLIGFVLLTGMAFAITASEAVAGGWGFKAPKISAPKIRAPKISAPRISVPKYRAPRVPTPQYRAPRISTPRVRAPRITPKVRVPQYRAPRIGVPQYRAPRLGKASDYRYKPNPLPWAPTYRWAATTKPFPNATTGIKGRMRGVPYEIGMRNTTVSDIVIGVEMWAVGAPLGTGTVVGGVYKRVWGR